MFRIGNPTRGEEGVEYESIGEGRAAGFDDVWGGCTPREVVGGYCEVGNSSSGDSVRGFVDRGARVGGVGLYRPI